MWETNKASENVIPAETLPALTKKGQRWGKNEGRKALITDKQLGCKYTLTFKKTNWFQGQSYRYKERGQRG